MEQPLVSVLMCSFNREKYIAEAIESVLLSTYQNFELIIVDNCSEDSTVAIAKSYQAKDDRVKVYQNQTNLGQFPNRNIAAGYAKGKYIKYVDSDDIIYPHCLEVMVAAIEKFPDAGIGFDDFGYNGSQPYPYFMSSMDIYTKHFIQGGSLYIGPLGSIYNRDFFFDIGCFDTLYGVAADYEFNLRAAAHKPVVLFQRDLYWYRTHEGQEINALRGEYKILNYSINKHHLYSSKCPLTAKNRRIAINDFYASNGRKILSAFWGLRFKDARKLSTSYKLPFKAYLLALCPRSIRHKLNLN